MLKRFWKLILNKNESQLASTTADADGSKTESVDPDDMTDMQKHVAMLDPELADMDQIVACFAAVQLANSLFEDDNEIGPILDVVGYYMGFYMNEILKLRSRLGLTVDHDQDKVKDLVDQMVTVSTSDAASTFVTMPATGDKGDN